MQNIVILGTGLAGYSLAREFRKLNTETPITMITADGGEYYSKPMLSNAFLKNKTPQELVINTAEKMAEQYQLTIHAHTTVSSLNLKNKIIKTNKGDFPYDRLVIATGAEVVQPPIAGDAAHQVLSVNNLEDYARFREALNNHHHVLIIGAGLIGCEFSNDLLRANFSLTVVDALDSPLKHLIPAEIGRHLKAVFAAEGVRWELGKTVLEVNESEHGLAVLLSDQTTVYADVVLSAIGLRFNKTVSEDAGLACNRGLVVNRYLETNQPDVYALGDCAEVEGQVLRYTMPLFAGAQALAKTLAGNRTAVAYPPMPVVIKTPDYPLVVLPPPLNVEGAWECHHEDEGETGLFYDKNATLRGFVLSRGAVKHRADLVLKVPSLW